MRAFRALTVTENGGGVKRSLVMKNTDDPKKGEVLIKVKYSCLNYHDLLVLTGDKSASAKYPVTPGMDASGIVAASASGSFKEGDEVIVTGGGLGIDTDGGFGEYISVKEDKIISLPTGLSLADAMTIGTEGLSAAIAVMDILSAGIEDTDKNILITGADMGTGAFATGIMSSCGYRVTAVTSKKGEEDFLKSLGAAEVIRYENFIDKSGSRILPAKYAAAIENFGGDALRTAVMSVKKNGSIAVCNMMMLKTSDLNLIPLISRGINVIGIDAVYCSLKRRMSAWYKLAGEWYLKTLPWLRDEISLMEIEEYIEKFVRGEVRGRIVINHEM